MLLRLQGCLQCTRGKLQGFDSFLCNVLLLEQNCYAVLGLQENSDVQYILELELRCKVTLSLVVKKDSWNPDEAWSCVIYD